MLKNYLSACSIIISLLLTTNTFSQYSQFNNKVKFLTSKDGLSQSEVTSIIKDKRGFLWIGTRGGLNRYDGKQFKVFNNDLNNPNSLSNNSIETIFEDKQGNIWIGTKSNGVTRYSPEFEQFKTIIPTNQNNLDLFNARIVSIEEGTTQQIWLGSWQKGIIVIDKNQQIIKHLLPKSIILDLHKTSDNRMIAVSSEGVFKYSLNGELIEKLSPRYLTCVIEDPISKDLYFGSWNFDIFKYNEKNIEFENIIIPKFQTSGSQRNNAYRLALDKDRNLWIATWGDGLYQYNIAKKRFFHYQIENSQNRGGKELYKDIISISTDKNGLMWLGTNGGGLCQVDNRINQFNSYAEAPILNLLPKEPIWSILKDSEKRIWLGIKGDNNLYVSKENSHLKSKPAPPILNPRLKGRKKGIKAIYEDLSGTFWASDNHTIYNVETEGDDFNLIPIKIKLKDSINYINIAKATAIFQSSDNYFWLGTQQHGVYKSSTKGNPLNADFENIFKKDRVTSFHQDKYGILWIGTYNGLIKYNLNNNTFIRIQNNPENGGLSSNIVTSLFEDTSENLWIGTTNGLNQFDLKSKQIKFNIYDTSDGLPNSYIHSIIQDDIGNIWVSTNLGLSRFNTSKSLFINFDANDGLNSNEFNDKIALKDDSGKLYFGSNSGLSIFDPKQIRNVTSPEVILTELRIGGETILPLQLYENKIILEKSISYTNSIELEYFQNSFSLSFTTINFNTSSNQSYQYKLIGKDNNWQKLTGVNTINYANLTPGKYEFIIRPESRNYYTNSLPSSIAIEVLPPFYKTNKAIVLYIVIFTLLLYLYRYLINKQNNLKNKLAIAQLNKEKEIEISNLKERFFTDVAHEFRTPLSLITGPVDALISQNLNLNSSDKNYLNTIHTQTQKLLNLVNQLLDFRKLEKGKLNLTIGTYSLNDFVQEIFLSFKTLADDKGIIYKFSPLKDDLEATFDANKMEVVLCNLLSNAFKHTNSKVFIILDKTPDKKGFFIKVTDDGTGIPENIGNQIFDRFYKGNEADELDLRGSGIGLALTKRYVEMHQGAITYESTKDKGTSFIIELKTGTEQITGTKIPTKTTTPLLVKETVINKSLKSKDRSESNKLNTTILIVDDNADIRAFIKSIFNNIFKTLEAKNGIEALEICQNKEVNLIISDLIMPNMDGLTLSKSIKENEKTLHVPVILLTARTSKIFEEQGYNAGADLYVTKPFNPNVLRAQVEGLLHGREKLREFFENSISLESSESISIGRLDQEFLNKVSLVVSENLNNPNLTREFLASEMAVSASTLYRRIKTITDLDISAFIRTIRLKKAAQMIKNKEDNISGIAYQVGFNDPKYFRKCFIQQFGITPSKYK
ncbi:hybrid sensor histidine kinase/response regulator transcription factor [Urechidicola sp. KH5]